ncbi:DUF6221 family protein [Actinoplanes siamensis]|uniref:DUF6221 family protein n=1 Tax=Actinoplanes siamensis TaxID=1223317 RepID=UPI0035A239ED
MVALKRPTRQQISAPHGHRPGTWNPARPIGPDPREPLLRLLALPYAGHPDYRQEWSPVSNS